MHDAQRVSSEWLTGTLTAAQLKQTWRLGGSIDGFFFFHLPRLLDPVLCSASFCYMLAAPNSQLSVTHILSGAAGGDVLVVAGEDEVGPDVAVEAVDARAAQVGGAAAGLLPVGRQEARRG